MTRDACPPVAPSCDVCLPVASSAVARFSHASQIGVTQFYSVWSACRGNSSKHKRVYLDVLIASRTLLYGAHISKWEDEEEPAHRDN
jgi:hypothetical protein